MAPGRIKLWESEIWIKRKYLVERKSPEEIAKLAGCSHMTIYRKLRDMGLIK